jgi:hypothetical protein
MSSELITLLTAIGAGIVLSVGGVVWWINRNPTVESTGEALPLFGGTTPGERPPVPARAAPASPSSRVAPAAEAPAASTVSPVPTYGPPREAPVAAAPPRPRPVIREFVSGVEPAPMARAAEPSAAEPSVAEPAPVSPVVNAAGVPGTMVEGHALRFSVPADGTLQFLPGRFEIGSGLDAGRELRFVRVDGPNGTEVTFGRAEGELYRHIQLRDKTVSRAHARMYFAHGAWHLENLSQTNPVVFNGDEMPSSGSRQLRNGDRVEMGEVQFTFRER